jgi:predicted ATPase
MIRSVLAVNFRSLGSAELNLASLTALVGPNGAGKSNVLDVLGFLRDAVRHGLEAAVAERQGFSSLRRWSRGRPFNVSFRIDVESPDTEWSWFLTLATETEADFRLRREMLYALPREYDAAASAARQRELRALSLEIDDGQIRDLLDLAIKAQNNQHARELGKRPFFDLRDGAWVVAPVLSSGGSLPAPSHSWRPTLPEIAKLDVHLRPLVDELSRIAVYSLFPPTLRQPQNPDPTRPMRRHGENWASTLRALDRERQGAELLAALGRIVGDIDDYRVTAVGGFLIPEFRHGVQNGRERWFGAAQESDGTLRIAALLTALLQEPPPSLIGIEEPELAVHPGALPILVDYLKEASQRTQVVITTHSPELLDLLPPESLRVVERVDGATTVRDLAADQKELLRKHLYSTSDLLRAEGLRGEPGEGLRNESDEGSQGEPGEGLQGEPGETDDDEASKGEAGDGQGLSRR